jgi:hypothetical protein
MKANCNSSMDMKKSKYRENKSVNAIIYHRVIKPTGNVA